MKIYLENNWSEQFIYGDTKTPGFFVGRKHEIQALKSIIKNNDSSSILISGIRGTGKTSFVHKTLSELDSDKYVPIFVNLGHVLSYLNSEQDDKKLFIKSLIRSLYLNNAFRKDKEIKKLYKESLGEFKKVEVKKDIQEDKKSFSIQENITLNGKTILLFLSVLFFAIGISLDNTIIRIISSIIGLGIFALTVNWKKELVKIFNNNEELIIDNSTEYLEIELEKWLKKINKKKKIIFIIDELDKVEEDKVFNFIKEFKNLFTRAFAHFIFISGDNAFLLAEKDRTLNVNEGGHYPTFFNHVFYIPLPSEKEIRGYLKEISKVENFGQEEISELGDYLLFLSGNDFFALKRLLSDIIFYDENNKPYIDVNELKNNDPYFKDKSKLFKYIMKWFINYNWSKLKRNWKNNSEMQKNVFDFLNIYYPNSFFDIDLNNNTEKELAEKLVRIGHYKKREINQNDIDKSPKRGLKQGNYIYECTFDFNNDVNAELREEEKNFNTNFIELIRIANILDDLPETYDDNSKFTNEKKVYEGRDGSKYSGVNLYSTYSNFLDLFNKLKVERSRLGIKKEDVQEANKRVLEQVNLVKEQFWKILINLLAKILPSDIIKNEIINNILHLFSGIPFINQLGKFENRVFRKNDNSKFVILIKEFSDFDILNNLEVLQNRKDILIININMSNDFKKDFVEIKVEYKDKIGRRRRKKQKLDNFINISLADIKDLSIVMKLVEKYFTNNT